VSEQQAFADRVAALCPKFQERGAEAEEARTLPVRSVAELLEAGTARLLAPRRFGGYELGLDAWLDLVLATAAADASHGWCASIIAHHSHYLGYFSEVAQEEVWADGPDVAIAGSVLPVCEVEQAEGGYRISGRSPFTSGVDHSAWAHVAGIAPASEGPAWTSFLIPRADFEVVDTWRTVGMRGTGSNTVVTREVFVPVERTLCFADLIAGEGPGSAGQANPIFRLPFASFGPLGFVATMVGAGRGAWEELRRRAVGKVGSAGRTIESAPLQVELARAASDLDAAELLLRRTVTVASATEAPGERLRAQSLRDFARAAELGVEAVDVVQRIAGTAGFGEGDALGRFWRDVHFAAAHVSLNPETSYSHWSRLELGLERMPGMKIF
jgi:3-hydroxy-9,10-secoandrosta-1,3,5(10)-triene-9,17-dione monooxygenase